MSEKGFEKVLQEELRKVRALIYVVNFAIYAAIKHPELVEEFEKEKQKDE